MPDTATRLSSIEKDVRRIMTDLYNGDDNPESGLVPELRTYLALDRKDKDARWKREHKLAAIAIIMTLMAWPSLQAITFFRDLYQITQEWHQIHKSQLQKSERLPDLALQFQQNAGGVESVHY